MPLSSVCICWQKSWIYYCLGRSKAQGYNENTNNQCNCFLFLTNFFPLLYKITKMYKSRFTENQGHMLALCTATIVTCSSVFVPPWTSGLDWQPNKLPAWVQSGPNPHQLTPPVAWPNISIKIILPGPKHQRPTRAHTGSPNGQSSPVRLHMHSSKRKHTFSSASIILVC